MKTKVFRVLVCLVMICAMLVNISPIRAEASVGTLLGSIAGVTSVNVPAGLVYGAAAIALGVMAGTNDDFVEMVDYAVDTATDWVKDGTVELLRVVDETGKAVYYAAGEMLESLRSWVFTENILTISEPMPLVKNASVSFANSNNNFSLNSSNEFSTVCLAYCYSQTGYYPYKKVVKILSYFNESGCSVNQTYTSTGYKSSFYANNVANNCFYAELPGGLSSSSFDTNISEKDLPTDIPYIYLGTFDSEAAANAALKDYNPMVSEVTTSADLILGQVSSVPIDGSSALDWSEEYASKRIYVTGGSNDPDPPDENNGKWFWPIALPLTAATLLAMSQADEWSGETPQEFDQYTQNTEFEILDRPEFYGYQAIEIAPVTNPGTNPDPGTDPDPTAPGEPSPEPDPEPDPEPVPDPSTDPDVDPDINPDAGGNGSQNPEPPGVSDYTLDLTDFFPFCIPFDIYDLVQVLDAEPEAPHFVFDVDFPYMEEPWHIDIDFSTWDPVALVLRRLELLLFIVGLAMATRNYYIRG